MLGLKTVETSFILEISLKKGKCDAVVNCSGGLYERAEMAFTSIHYMFRLKRKNIQLSNFYDRITIIGSDADLIQSSLHIL